MINEMVGKGCTIVMVDITTVMDFFFYSKSQKYSNLSESCITEVQKKNANQKRQRSGERLPSCYE